VIVSPGLPTPFPVGNVKPDMQQGMAFCMLNNVWGERRAFYGCVLGVMYWGGVPPSHPHPGLRIPHPHPSFRLLHLRLPYYTIRYLRTWHRREKGKGI
jgi:hypothetical protein